MAHATQITYLNYIKSINRTNSNWVLVRDINNTLLYYGLGTVCGYCCYGFIKHIEYE